MKSPKDFEKDIERIFGSQFKGGKIEMKFAVNSKEDAKAKLLEIRHKEKELKYVKSEISIVIKTIRSSYTAKKAEVGTGMGAGLKAGLFGKKSAGKSNAIEKENLRRSQVNAIAPYETLSRAIDNIVLQMNSAKIQLDAYAKSA